MSAATLVLLRHAKSSWSNPHPDANRPLAARGIRDVQLTAQWLQEHLGCPDRVLCSPAVRCRQTLALLSKIVPVGSDLVRFDSRIYGANVPTLKAVIKPALLECQTLMVVGHNPGLDDLLQDLSADEITHTRRGKLLTTCAAAILELGPFPLLPDSASLVNLVRPKEILRTLPR